MTPLRAVQRQLTTSWGRRQIGYSLQLEDRRDLLICVEPDLRVVVRAPAHKPVEQVLGRIKARRAWIAKQLAWFEQLTPLPPPRFVSGETVMYLGREYRLRLERSARAAVLHAGRLHVGVGGQSARGGARAARAMVLAWYRDRANFVLPKRLAKLQSEIEILRFLEPQLRIRVMSRRWGSCTSRGTVTINPALIQAPASCVDYVLVHELVHLLEPTHSRRFHKLMNQALPDWMQKRARLATAAVRWP